MDSNKTLKDVKVEVNNVFEANFSRTPLRQRLEDIFKESCELYRYTDMRNLKEETGDVLASVIQLCNENDWDVSELVSATLAKIERRQSQYRALGRKVNVAILGGAFNPITEGHIKLAQFVLNSSRTFDEVWICPCYQHLYGKNLVSPEHRLEMCRIAAKVDGRIKVCDYEIEHQLGGETYHFAKRLLQEDFAKDKYDFSFIIGLDNANTFDKWVNYQDLERMVRFVVVSRLGVKRDDKVDWYMKNPHIYLQAETEIPEVSSTDIRILFINYYRTGCYDGVKNQIVRYLNKGVFEYIVKNDLYNQQ